MSRRHSCRFALRSLLVVALCALPFAFAAAQSATATLSGTVEDERGAVVPGASVTVINNATLLKRDAITNSEGYFTVPLLQPGSYTVRAQHDGFRIAQIDNVVLNVGDQKALQIPLKTGDIKETVNITGEAPLINESPAVGTVVDRQFVGNLPLNGRSFQALITLAPGVVLTKTGVQQQGQFSVNGQRANANYFTVDGVSANIGASASTFPGQSGAGSLPGLSASGGTNNLVSDANDWFANRAGLPKPALRQNDFGGVVGGPLYLPRFGEGGASVYNGKNRTFFFFSYEGLRLRQPQVGITDVPSLSARQAAPSAVQPLLNLYPRPNGPEGANGLAAFSSSFSNPTTLNATSIRVDSNVSDKVTVFGRYNYAPSEAIIRGAVGQALSSRTHFNAITQTLTVGSTYIFTPKISNDLRFNYSRNRAESLFTLDNFGGAVVPAESIIFPSNQSSLDAFFVMSISDGQGTQAFLGRSPNNLQRQVNVVDGVSVVTGNHQLKFGVDYRRLSPVFSAPDYQQTLIFNSVGNPGSAPSGTILSGLAALASISSQKSPQVAIFSNLSIYAQDTWKVVPRLTLTYGLRWEYVPPPQGINGNDPLAVTQVNDPATISIAPRGTPLWKTTYNNFAPRVGVAYQLSQKPGQETILRGGFGIFYDLGNGPASNAFAFAFPFTATKRLFNVGFPLSPSDAAAPVAGPTPSSFDFFYAFDPGLKLPRVYQWNFTVEQSLGANQSMTASYVAAVGRRLFRQESLRNIRPDLLGTLVVTKNNATSDYHGIQLQFQRRLSRGLQALASYTWSKSLDISSGDSAVSSRTDIFDPSQDRGPSDFDVRHAFTGAITYNVPAPHVGEFGRKILSDWSVDTIFTARTATPVNVTYTAAGTAFGSLGLRPDLVPGTSLYLNDPAVGGGKRFNPGAFAFSSTLRQGTLGRNVLRGFGLWQVDLALRRQFNLGERYKLQFRTEFFNVFNHPNFADPVGTLGTFFGGTLFANSQFGRSASMLGRSLGNGGLTGGFNPLYQVGGPRSIQLSLKLEF